MSFIESFNYSAANYDTSVTGIIRQRLKAICLESIDANGQAGQFFYTEIKNIYRITDHDLFHLLSTSFQGGKLMSICTKIALLTDRFLLLVEEVDSKTNRVSLSFYSTYIEATQIQKDIELLFEPYITKFDDQKAGMYVSWGVKSGGGDISYVSLYNSLNEVVYNEAYPYINSINDYIEQYIQDVASVLLFMGKPGTGKTRFLRYIAQRMSCKKYGDTKVLYTMDDNVFSEDKFFIEFFKEDYDLLILEDIDLKLRPRSDGNDMMHKLLAGTDGFLRNTNKKIVLTTNLTNVGDIDSALLREGRCFGKIESRLLSSNEAQTLLQKIDPTIKHSFSDPNSVAQVYQIAQKKA